MAIIKNNVMFIIGGKVTVIIGVFNYFYWRWWNGYFGGLYHGYCWGGVMVIIGGSVRVFFALLNQEMASVSLHQVRFFCEINLKKIRSFDKIDYIFVALSADFSQHIILNMFSREKNVLPTIYIDYLIETSITVNWMVGIDKGKYT